MRIVYAGVPIDAGHTVWIFDRYAERPVFHAATFRSGLEPDEDGATGAGFTRCGIAVDANRRRGPGGSAFHLRPLHAKRFGRPCVRCWPELRNGQLELKATPLRMLA